jgi:hypothetical protein
VDALAKLLAVSAALLFFPLLPLAGQTTWIYRDRTGQAEIRIRVWKQVADSGKVIHSALSDGDGHHVFLNAVSDTVRYDFESPQRETAYSAVRDGNTLYLQGTLRGRPLSRSIAIDAKPWYESMEWSLRNLALSGSPQPVVFWVLQPFEARAYLLQARVEKTEDIVDNDRTVPAIRVKVSPMGLLTLFWSALFWYRPADGLNLRYEAVRGLPGTPKTTVELMEEQ